MNRLQNIASGVTDGAWRAAILVGLASASITAVHYWQSPGHLFRFEPVLFAGVLVGFLYNGRAVGSRRAGFRTGLVGALPVLWPVLDVLVFIPGLDQPAWFSGVQVVLLAIAVVFLVAFFALFGMIGAMLGNWLAEKTDRHRSFVTGY